MKTGIAPVCRRILISAFLAFSAFHVPARGAEVLIAAAGDIACDPDSAITAGECKDADTAALITSRRPLAVLALGDNQYENGSLKDFQRAYDTTWGLFKGITFPTVGNHEYLSGTAQGYFDYFGSQAGSANGYYAFDLNGWRLYSLNAECDRINCDEERAWMQANVIANHRTCQLMFMHRPLYSSGGQHSTFGQPFWIVGYNNNFELALAGHEHRYERFARMNPYGAVMSNGIQSFTVGTGGKSLFRAGIPARGSRFRDNLHYGVLFLKLRLASYVWEYRDTAGLLIDSGTGKCH